jgi:arsenate reductase
MTKNILFLCTGNSCRSQMGEGLVNLFLSSQWRAYSAGTKPSGYVHPLAIAVMAELEIDISVGKSKHPDELRDVPFDLVVTVCDDAAEDCPLWLGKGRVIHHSFYDPAKAEGTEEERLTVFRRVRDEIKEWAVPFLAYH